jgi:DNA end-binding protein Ku
MGPAGRNHVSAGFPSGPGGENPVVAAKSKGSKTGRNERDRAPRPLWSGSISFGLVNVPVRVFSAVHEHKLSFHLVHETDDGPIGYQKICKVEDRPVSNDEIVRAFEVEKGELVHLTDDDFAAVQVEGQHSIDLEDFVPYEQIDPAYFSHTYLVGPQDGAERPYALLVRAMEDSSLAGIGKFVLRGRQYLGCLRVRNGLLTLEQMYFADEVDDPETILPAALPSVGKRELEMGLSLIQSFAGDWEPEKYTDTYRDALYAIIEEKRAGREVHQVPVQEPESPPDLIEALRRSLEQVEGGRARRPARTGGNGGAKPKEPTKSELEERARELEIPGRSSMTKDELAEAVASAE